jgi:alkylation response protein AidB-like acyl-CoA dehydrogenase
VLVAAMCAGMLGAAVEVGVARTKARSSFGVALADHQGLRWKMADVATAAFTARTAAHAAAAAVEAGAPGAAVAAAHAKKHATTVALPALADAAQALGAWGLHREDGHPLARHLAAAKVAQYLDGTTEVQNLVIGRSLYGS